MSTCDLRPPLHVRCRSGRPSCLRGTPGFSAVDILAAIAVMFGSARAVDFGGLTTVWFLSDGSLVDAANLPLSGTVFVGIATRPLSARAVTVLGPTGRVQGYKWDSRTWR
ncbi:MAG: hypothetical protein NTY02_10445 [Acidobacteria bacterium]|nr:hypothetical protein [Acidobacteriota bacterium]